MTVDAVRTYALASCTCHAHHHHHSQVNALVESLVVTVDSNIMTLKIRTLLTNYRG